MTLTRSQQKSGIIYETLASEEMVLAVPTKLVTALDMRNGDLALLREEPLSSHRKPLPSGRSLIPFLKMPDSPNVLFETSNNHAIISMIHENICCGILPMYYMIRKMRQLPIFNYLTILPGRLLLHIARDIISASRRGH